MEAAFTSLLNLVISDILALLFTLPIYAATGLTSEYFNLGTSDKVRCEFAMLKS